MNRRDLLKWIGIGGVGAVANVVSGKDVEAAEIAQPVEPTLQDHIDYLNTLYVGDTPVIQGTVSAGSVSYWPRGAVTLDGYEDAIPLYVEMTPAQLRRFEDPAGGDE